MRRILVTTTALGVLALAAQLTAQEVVKPGPQHDMLKAWQGTWDTSIKTGGESSKGTSVCKIGLNGLWLFESFKGEVAGMPYEGRGATSYDPAKKKFVGVWMDSMSASVMLSAGTYDKATKTMTMVGDMPAPDGKTVKAIMTTVVKDADTKVFTLKGSADGKEFEMIQVTYKRRAK